MKAFCLDIGEQQAGLRAKSMLIGSLLFWLGTEDPQLQSQEIACTFVTAPSPPLLLPALFSVRSPALVLT